MSWLLRGVEVDGQRCDCRIEGPRITHVAPHLPIGSDDRVLDGCGGALLPGLADHHIHLLATAAAVHSVDVSGPAAVDRLALRAAGQ